MNIGKQNKIIKKVNIELHELSNEIFKHGLCIDVLPELDGNSIFASLCYLGYADNEQVLRNAITLIMYEFREYKGLYPIKESLIPKQLFNNKQRQVINMKNNKIIDYTYEIMCKKLSRDGSNDINNIHILLLTISRIFNVEFQVFNNKQFDVYKAINKNYTTVIYFGIVGKHHCILLKKTNSFAQGIVPEYELI